MTKPKHLTRREMFGAAATAGLCLSPAIRSLLADESRPAFKIGACDWSLRVRQNPVALEVARKIGLDGVEVSFDGGEQFDLRDEKVRQQYRQASRKSGVEIPSLAMGVLNRVPYATDPAAERWVEECVDAMVAMDVKIVLLAFFGKGDIKDNRQLQEGVIRRLKKVAPKAEKAGVVLGLETWLDADAHLRILDAVASPAVRVYYDVANMTKQGYDVPAEIRRLGRDRICQIHMKESGCLLGDGQVDFPKIKQAIDAIDYRGWFILEGATVADRSVEECYKANRKFLDDTFAAG